MADSTKIPIPQRDVACQNLITDSNVIHHGNLRRRRMLNSFAEMVNVKQLKLSKVIRWRQSYVVLHKGCIYIYDNEMSGRPSRATSLYGFTGIEPCSQEVSKGVSWPFKLVCALEDKDRTYYFSAPSEKDMTKWIDCIQGQMLAIFRANERSVPVAFVSPQSQGAGESKMPRPPLPPPRDKILEAEYVLKDDEDDEGDDDYIEIDEEEMDKARNKSEFSKVQSASALNSRPPAAPLDCQPQAAPRQFQPTATRSVPPAPVAPKLAPKPKAFAAAAVIKTPSVDTETWRESDESVGLKDNVEYFGAPQYLELAEDTISLRKSGIPPESYWEGKPDEADEMMRMLSHNGAFMVRDSSEKGGQTLIVRVGSSVIKYKIQVNDKGHMGLMTAGPYFESMASLINFYKSTNIPRHNSPLTLPYSLVRKA